MTVLPSGLRVAWASSLPAILVLCLALPLAAQTVSLHSVMVAPDGTVTVTYSKDFATCAHLMTSTNVLVHAQNIFCTSGINVVVTAPSSAFNANLASGLPLKLCHGNNYGICSALTPVTPNTLTGAPAAISVSAGGTQTLVLAAGAAHAGRNYLMAGTVSGTSPGFAIGAYQIPLNIDFYFDFTLSFPNTFPLANSAGVLGAGGAAVATFTLPPGTAPAFAGITAHHAFAVADAAGAITLVSNAAALVLVP